VVEEELEGAKNLIKERFLDEALVFLKQLRPAEKMGKKRKL
jgi:hypothetical protein